MDDKTERRSRMAVAHYTGADLKIRHLPPATHPIGSCDGWKLGPLGEDAGIVTTKAFWGHSCGGAKGVLLEGDGLCSGLDTTMAFWAGSGGGAESGILKCGTTMVVWERWILKCGTTMVVWERSGGGAKGVVLEWEWSLIRNCHHYCVLGTFRWGS